jgi:hypothetical protein
MIASIEKSNIYKRLQIKCECIIYIYVQIQHQFLIRRYQQYNVFRCV